MNFHIGQKVVCVNAIWNTHCTNPLVKGNMYTVYGFYTCKCGSEQIYLDEIPDKVTIACKCHRTEVRRHSYYIFRFRPLQYFDIYSELFENKKEFGEKRISLIQFRKKTKTIKAL
jgi:hypothetical protein